MPLDVRFDDSQFPDTVHRRMAEALRERRVPGRFLYDSPRQAARWLAYHQAWSPSRLEADLLALYDSAFDAALASFPEDRPLRYIGIGAGGGKKDARFLKRARGRDVAYTAADTSPALAVKSALSARAARPDVPILPVVVDVEAQPARAVLGDDAPRAWILSCFGMLPNFEAASFFGYLRGLMAEADRLLVSANLSPGPHARAAELIVPQYDNLEARAWYLGALLELGATPEDLDLAVSSRPLREDGAIWRIEARATARRDLTLDVFGQPVALPHGEPLEVFHSDRYTAEAMPEVFREAGFELQASFVFENEEEGIYLARVRG